jgi:hypothetical protein
MNRDRKQETNMTKNVARNRDQCFFRARYLDTAIKHFDLSFGAQERCELINFENEANQLSNSGKEANNFFDLDTFWDHPITGREICILYAVAQHALAKTQGLPFVRSVPYLILPRLGKAAVRLILRRDGRPDPSDWLIEVGNLDDVQSHFLCSCDPQGWARYKTGGCEMSAEVTNEIRMYGWLSSAEIRKAKKERLVEGGPEIYTIPFQQLHELEVYDNVP